MKNLVVILTVLVLLFVLALSTVYRNRAEQLEVPGEMSAYVLTADVQEDDPEWNCHTMGNRICGPKHQNREHRQAKFFRRLDRLDGHRDGCVVIRRYAHCIGG